MTKANEAVTAETITDEQIKALWEEGTNTINGATLMDALGAEWGPCMRKPSLDETRTARAHCAEILNARLAMQEGE
jgi:hypothetical protein